MDDFWLKCNGIIWKWTYKALKEGKAKITIKATTEYNKEIYASLDVEVAKKETVDENDENSNKDNEITSPILQRLSCYQQ